VFAVSEKTARQTRRLAKHAHVVVVENGMDHPSRWPVPRAHSRLRPYLITFGHHNNKRPDLAIRALSSIGSGTDIDLVVLGAKAEYRAELAAIASECNVAQRCRFPGFVTEDQYQALIQGASGVLLLSADEGYGLPVAEAAALRIPAIVTNDSGLGEIHPQATVAHPCAEAIAQAIHEALTRPTPGPTQVRTWSAVAHEFRQEVLRNVDN
jgi:glycosyltransferase involved in cell wall biosynthesis